MHDASDVAFGGFSASLDGVMANGMFTSEDLGQSSTYRELKAIYYVLLSCVEQLRQRRVRVCGIFFEPGVACFPVSFLITHI